MDSHHNYSEADTRANYIDPALQKAGWQAINIRREYYFTDGRKLFGNKRGERCFVDYLLKHNNTNLAIIEAKKSSKEPTEGLQQAINYAQKLGVDLIFSSNGKKTYAFSLLEGKGEYIESYPTPEELYNRIVYKSNSIKERLLNEPYYITGQYAPRYYQELAVQKVMEHIADGDKRILLTLATGTGKTYIAFQIVHKLLKAKWNLEGSDKKPKILFLADRNVLADQAINTFNPYEKDLIKINGEEIRRRNGIVPTNAYIFFAIYQAIADRKVVDDKDKIVEAENIGGYYKEYPKDFFDLIIIDECHRGSANEDGSWRAILDYFDKAVHVGMTATPKRLANIDTYNYFGKPVFEYSLKEGINDGFLTPYKVKRIKTNLDEYIYTNEDTVLRGQVVKEMYGISDFDRNIVIPKRTEMIAQAILDNIHPMDKTIVFCVDQNHALLMRDAINKIKQVKDPLYCVRVTSDEGSNGRQLLERFQDNDKDIPVILTSSQMLTTGVDARNVRNIVLCRTINSVVEFKQIVGRGTRLFDGKDFFTILDFTGATNLFYDAEWDGPPVDGDTGGTGTGPKPPKTPGTPPEPTPPGGLTEKLEIALSNGRKLKVIDIETRFVGADGKPLSIKEFLEQITAQLPGLFDTEEQLREKWANPESRLELLNQLSSSGFDQEQLDALVEMFNAKDSDYFDLLAFLAFNTAMISRHERSEQVANNSSYFNSYHQQKAKDFLYFILKRYEEDGIKELDRDKLPQLVKLAQLGTPKETGDYFGGMHNLIKAYYDLQQQLYKN